MAQKTLVEELKDLSRELNERYGPLTLLMLLSPDLGVELWNVIVSARGLDSMSRREAIGEIVHFFHERLQEHNWKKVFGVEVLQTQDPFVEALNDDYMAEAKPLRLNNVQVSGVEIPQALLLRSKAA